MDIKRQGMDTNTANKSGTIVMDTDSRTQDSCLVLERLAPRHGHRHSSLVSLGDDERLVLRQGHGHSVVQSFLLRSDKGTININIAMAAKSEPLILWTMCKHHSIVAKRKND